MPPEPRFPAVLAEWTIDPAVVVLLALAAATYLRANARLTTIRGRGASRTRTASFLGGLAAIAIADLSPVGRYAETLFSIHMLQHLILVFVAAPLILAGAPVRLMLAASPSRIRPRVAAAARSRTLAASTHPVVGWVVFVGAMWASHYTGLYQAALRNDVVHALEHVLYLTTALAFWSPVIGTEPARYRLSYPARLAYLFLALPAGASLGASLYTATRVLYPTYAAARSWGPSPLDDQRAGGALMWIVGGLAVLVALLAVAAVWARRERAITERVESRPAF